MKNLNISGEEYLVLRRLNEHLETNVAINMYATLVLIVFGLVNNLLSLSILIYSSNKLPRIASSKYLILLTITNTAYLALQFYMGTYIRMIYHFKLDYNRSYHILDSSQAACKILTYLRYSSRILNALLTVGFSLERLVAVYKPFYMRSFDPKSSSLFGNVSIALSFIIPIYSIFLCELVPSTSEISSGITNKFNLSRSVNFYSVTPSLGPLTCSASSNNSPTFFRVHFFVVLFVLLCNFVVSVSILAIIAKLKHKRSSILLFFRTNVNVNKESMDLNKTEESLVEKGVGEELIEKSRQSSLMLRFNSTNLNNSRAHDTKLLGSLSVSFLVFNTPYLIILLYTILFSIRNDFKSSYYQYSTSNLVNILRMQSYLTISEIFQLANFSITGLLLFCSGRIFRLHAFKWFKTIFARKR